MLLTLGIAYWAVSVLTALFLLVCLVLILTVLIQRPQGGGLSGAFGAGGGAGSGQTAFGAKTGDALTYATIMMFVIYLAVAVGLNFAARPEGHVTNQPTLVSPEDGAEEGAGAGETTEGVADDAATDDPAGDAAPDDSAGGDAADDEPAGADAPEADPSTTPGASDETGDDTTNDAP